MRLRKGITDRLALEYWRDYQRVLRDGNPLGLSYTEYVAQRVIAAGVQFVYTTSTSEVDWHVSACGHQHPFGESCNTWTAT
jgi:hypothetical protein